MRIYINIWGPRESRGDAYGTVDISETSSFKDA